MHFRHTASFAFLLAGLGLCALTAPAMADARDDVFAGAQRCAANADDRGWLDCYYGAAQPMRARLGLPPAPASQTRLVPGAGDYAAPPSAEANARDDVLATSQRCAAIGDDRNWLDCYYGSAQAMRARLGLPPAPAAQLRLVQGGGQQFATASAGPAPAYGIPVPGYVTPNYAVPNYAAPGVAVGVAAGPKKVPPIPKPPRNEGTFASIFGSSKPLEANMHMASYTMDKGGKFIITLTDGEIWKQDDADEGISNWKRSASYYVVNVYQGALSSYNMEVKDDSHLYKVHRLN